MALPDGFETDGWLCNQELHLALHLGVSSSVALSLLVFFRVPNRCVILQ